MKSHLLQSSIEQESGEDSAWLNAQTWMGVSYITAKYHSPWDTDNPGVLAAEYPFFFFIKLKGLDFVL